MESVLKYLSKSLFQHCYKCFNTLGRIFYKSHKLPFCCKPAYVNRIWNICTANNSSASCSLQILCDNGCLLNAQYENVNPWYVSLNSAKPFSFHNFSSRFLLNLKKKKWSHRLTLLIHNPEIVRHDRSYLRKVFFKNLPAPSCGLFKILLSTRVRLASINVRYNLARSSPVIAFDCKPKSQGQYLQNILPADRGELYSQQLRSL